ncbi:MAG TPA: class I SAM-dependent methyltransferase [Pseudomonas sp.]|uniref:class I SAM-dependent methyltransferase n=1 Tax=Pseudomonas sp. TaxID=306 RepID=UPI002C1C1621|nr:class I SAM-dependent methyltransferase [Pseudomonas sp.]HRL92117.1 class I SAM-dependent methyltransferase [Pseudomonas sp.]
MSDYITLNKANWDERAPLHAASAGYETQALVDDPAHLSEVVRFDLPLLGDISGAKGVHLQCHIGTDTLSLARLGAHMTGLDFSPASIAQARLLAERAGARLAFVEADVYEAAEVLPRESFDLVYTSIGALNWLPSIDRWANAVASLLKPDGRLFIREGHPVLFSLNEDRQDALVIEHPYFEQETPQVWEDDSSYVETDARLTATITHEWNHGMGEIISALLSHGMQITGLVEHDSIPWEALPGQMSCGEDGEWRLDRDRWRMPLSYTLQASKRPR